MLENDADRDCRRLGQTARRCNGSFFLNVQNRQYSGTPGVCYYATGPFRSSQSQVHYRATTLPRASERNSEAVAQQTLEDRYDWRSVPNSGPLGPYLPFVSSGSRGAKLIDGVLSVKEPAGWVAVPGRWLRDRCPCCRNQETGQKTVNVLKLNDADCVMASVVEVPDGSFHVEFEDGHHSTYPSNTFTDRGLMAVRTLTPKTSPETS